MPVRRTVIPAPSSYIKTEALPSKEYPYANLLYREPIKLMEVVDFVIQGTKKVFPYLMCVVWGFLVAYLITH